MQELAGWAWLRAWGNLRPRWQPLLSALTTGATADMYAFFAKSIDKPLHVEVE